MVVAGFDSVEASTVIAARAFAGTSTTVSRSYTLLSTDATNNVTAVYYPPQQGYLIGWSPTSSATKFNYKLYDSNVNEMTQFGTPAAVTWSAATNTTVGASLICPAVSSQPVVDLPFEELPGASDFVDNSGYNTAVFCDAGQCPVAGISGAPNAIRSDYALRFDGVNDRLAVNRALTDDFTIAMWVKTAGQATTGMLVDQGPTLTNGWGVYLSGSQLVFQGNQQVSANANLSDNQWHFITITRNRPNGSVSIYKDGALLTSGPHNTAVLNAQGQLWIGGNAANASNFAYKGDMDAVQLYPVALSASAVQALYNRTLQSYCVAAGVTATGNTFPWSRIGLQQQDVRGGRISASSGLKLIVDKTAPTAQITSHANNAVVAPDTVIGGTASDSGVGVGKVEVSTDNGATWQTATGANTWSFSLAGLTGVRTIRARATDLLGNVGVVSPAINVTVDATAPALTINAAAGTLKPTKNAAGQWQVPVSGTATDSSGLKAGTLLVKLTQASGVGVAQSQQAATLTGNTWSSNYLLDPGLFDPTGSYTVTAQVDDSVGNRTVANSVVRLDATGPVAALSAVDLARTVISETLTIGGVISDTNSTVGIDKLEIAFTPIEQLAALPPGLTSTQAEAQLNRQWLPVTLAQRGAGVAQTTWSFAIPAGLEDSYQIDLRGTDLLGNVSITSAVWRGIIDTRDPRVVMTATATGATYVNTADNTPRYEVRFVCGVQDRNLNEASFACPGKGLAEPVRSFENNPALQALFPDLTLRTGLAISYTLWTTTPNPAAAASACDSFGRCAQASTGQAAKGTAQAASLQAAPAPGAPIAVVVNPTNNSFVAAGNTLTVTVAAEAGALLKTVTLSLDNQVVQTLNFAQTDNVTRTLRTLAVSNLSEGLHTLTAQATAWDNSSQTTLYPVSFTLDQNAPVVTIDPNALTLASTWEPGSGVLRFHGNANDSVGLVAVQIREGDNAFTDATFGNGAWRVALPVTDPEGRTLNITARAIDRAGRISEVNQPIGTQLSAADAPDTTITSGPANPSAENSASFVFTGTVSAVVYECSLDNGVYTPCGSPMTYNDLSKGNHTFSVRAIDGRGLPDLSPATFAWAVNASALDATLTSTPANPSSSRSAQFSFSGTGASIECRLDGAAYGTCTSPASYSGLSNGEHTFLVRARNGNAAGAAARFTWTVVNAAPVANAQTVNTNQDQAVAITLQATDDDALVYQVTQPAHGVVQGVPPALTYSPDTGYTGQDSFTFVANDGQSSSNAAVITINVAPTTPPTPTATLLPATETPTATPTNTALPATETPTPTPTNTAIPVTDTPTATATPLPATATNTPVAPSPTPTNTPVPVGTLIGACGNYTVYLNNGVYRAAGWTGAIKVGNNSNNTLTGTNGPDLILGLGGNDKLDGGAGDDVLCGDDGVDQLLGGGGNDYLDGGLGNDVLNGGAGDYDRLVAGEGNDTLLDADGVLSASGGPGNDLFTIALRNGWRDQTGQPRFTGLAAGYGNDTVGLAILNTTRFFLDITGDERDNPPSPLEGTNDVLALAGVIDPASTINKFEKRTGVVSASDATEGELPTVFEGFPVDPTTLTDTSGADFLTEPVGGDDPQQGSDPIAQPNQLFLPLVSR